MELTNTSNSSVSKPDTSQVAASVWPFQMFPLKPAERSARFLTIFRRSVLTEIERHGRTTPDVEVCGVLVGSIYQDDVGPYLVVEASIRGTHATSQAAQVTFTAETWNFIHTRLEAEHPEQRIVGWYHTHPGFGIFLSEMDLFIHRNFFDLPYQVAYVFDPLRHEAGLFEWRLGDAVATTWSCIEDGPSVSQLEPVVELTVTAAANASLEQVATHRARLTKRWAYLVAVGAVCAVLVLLWLLAIAVMQRPAIKGHPMRSDTLRVLSKPRPADDPASTGQPTQIDSAPPSVSNESTIEQFPGDTQPFGDDTSGKAD